MPEIDLSEKKLEIVYVHIAALKKYKNNAKRHPQKQIEELKEEITRNGFVNPLLIDKDKVIITGHGRLMAAAELGYVELPCIMADDWTEEQIQAHRHFDNRIQETGTNFEILKTDLFDMKSKGFDIKFTGYDESIFNKFPEHMAEKEFDENITTEHKCPSCGYRF